MKMTEQTSRRKTLGPVGIALLHRSSLQQAVGCLHVGSFPQPLVIKPETHDDEKTFNCKLQLLSYSVKESSQNMF